jgi:hypothetical protein
MTEQILRRPSRGLFKQYNKEGTEDLDHWREVFVEMCDPTGYAAALELCGSWKEWNRIVNDWAEFKDAILPDWVAEVEIKLRSASISALAAEATGAGKGSGAAARWLAEGRYIQKKAGRPSKAQVAHAAKVEAGVIDEVGDDLSRVAQVIDLKVV